MAEFKKDENEIGASWLNSSTRGDFFTGMVNGQAVVVFKNERKAAGSNAPDWRILRAKPKSAAVTEPTDW